MLSSAARGKLGFMCQKMVEILIFHLKYEKIKKNQTGDFNHHGL